MVKPVTNNLKNCSFLKEAVCHEEASCVDVLDGSIQCLCPEGATGDGMKGSNHTGCKYREFSNEDTLNIFSYWFLNLRLSYMWNSIWSIRSVLLQIDQKTRDIWRRQQLLCPNDWWPSSDSGGQSRVKLFAWSYAHFRNSHASLDWLLSASVYRTFLTWWLGGWWLSSLEAGATTQRPQWITALRDTAFQQLHWVHDWWLCHATKSTRLHAKPPVTHAAVRLVGNRMDSIATMWTTRPKIIWKRVWVAQL